MKSICLIDVYFGKLPKWINIFIETCKYNPTVEWIIFIDDKIPKNKAKNIKFIKSSFKIMNAYMSSKLGLNITVRKGYKYCDIRPAFGHIFEEELKGFDYWGHTDLDVLFGDIRTFITESLTNQYDIISTDSRKICGPFTIFKNIDKINYLYKEQKKPPYQEIFENSDKHYHSNEQAMTDLVNHAHNNGILKKTFRDLHKADAGSYCWEDGKIKVKGTEEITMYVHLRRFKGNLDPKLKTGFEVNPQGFVGENEWVKEVNKNGK